MTTRGTEQDRRLATIRGLLAKAEATDFEHEAEVFFNKASELIARWAIDDAMLWDGAGARDREEPDELQLRVDAPYLAQKAILVSGVARANGCRAVRLSAGRGARSEIVSVVGFPSDLKWVETLVTSLLVQLTSTMLRAAPRGLSASASASWRRSYIVGFAETVTARLEADRAEAADDRRARGPSDGDPAVSAHGGGADGSRAGGAAGSGPSAPSVALVLASREREVDSEYRRRFPHVRSSWASSGGSASGRNAGRRAGREASLTRGSLGARGILGPRR